MKEIISDRLREHGVPTVITEKGIVALSNEYGRAVINSWDDCRRYLRYIIDAPAVFIGVQEGAGNVADVELYNLTEDVEGHPSGSTVSRQTLERLGFRVGSSHC